LEAFRHAGSEQKLCLLALRGFGRKKIPQCEHLRFLIVFAIDLAPPGQ
jgi:hypothetical protein